jgi:hypothetical protein
MMPDLDARRAAMDVPCTLNDRPATVVGFRNDFATVVDLESGLGCEFAWPTVYRILTSKEGRFYS